jgi:hypothetical protein
VTDSLQCLDFHVCAAGLQCSAWPLSPEVDSLLLSVGVVGRDVLSVVQDMACYKYTATHLNLTQLGGCAWPQLVYREQCAPCAAPALPIQPGCTHGARCDSIDFTKNCGVVAYVAF